VYALAGVRRNAMSKITVEDYAKIQEPCKSCPWGLEAFGRGKNKKVFCKKAHAKLMGEGLPYWFQIPDCPQEFPR
jgi:cytidine deaminase